MEDETNHIPRGVNYHTDSRDEFHMFHPRRNRELSDLELRRELSIIKDRLHCNAIRVVGNNPDEAVRISRMSQETGITPWLSPRFIGATIEQTKEQLRKYCNALKTAGIDNVPLIVANELIFDASDVMGDVISEYAGRIEEAKKRYWSKGKPLPTITEHIQSFFSVVRKSGMKGLLTYAALPDEIVEWQKIQDPNYAVGVNLYWERDRESGEAVPPEKYQDTIKKLIENSKGRRVVITEFGSVPQQEGLSLGGGGWRGQGSLDVQSQVRAYEAYMNILSQHPEVGYFAFAFYEPKDTNPHQSYGLASVSKDPEGKFEERNANQLMPAAEVLASYNKKLQNTPRGTILEE